MDSELMIAQVHAPAGVLIDVAAAPGWRVSAGPASFAGAARVTFVPECLLSEQ
jgi:hypothetical protein